MGHLHAKMGEDGRMAYDDLRLVTIIKVKKWERL